MTEAQHAAEWITGPISLEYAAAEHKAQKLADELAEARDECERLREALRPFARVAEHDIGDDETDGDRFLPIVDRRHARAPLLTGGDLRRALAALKEPTDA